MQLISKFNKGIIFYYVFTDIISKYAWVIPLKDQKDITITNAFQKILAESNPKPKKIQVDKSIEYEYEIYMKLWLEKKDIETY